MLTRPDWWEQEDPPAGANAELTTTRSATRQRQKFEILEGTILIGQIKMRITESIPESQLSIVVVAAAAAASWI